MIDSISDLRKEYRIASLDENDVHTDPFVQFEQWFEQMSKVSQSEVNAMTLATATPEGVPSARTVLLKGIDDRGFQFFTSKVSRKGMEIASNPKSSLLFYWPELERQVRIDGDVELLEDSANAEYFHSRPRGSQLAAHIEMQSQIVPSRAFLESQMNDLDTTFAAKPIQPPEHWGGYRVVPAMFEFWQGRPNRLHDRVQYVLEDGDWTIERLGP